MKILFVTALLLAVAASKIYSQECHTREVDSYITSGLSTFEYWGFPPDEETFTSWCEILEEGENNWGNYSSKCLSPLLHQIITLMVGSNEVGRKLCVRGSEERARYFMHVDCLSEEAESDEFKATLRDLQLVIEKLFDVPYKQRFPLMCCGFRRFHKDSDAITDRRCGPDAVEIAKSFMNMVTTELPDTICQKFEPESGECQNLLPAPGTPPMHGEIKSELAELLDRLFYNPLAFSSGFLPSFDRDRGT